MMAPLNLDAVAQAQVARMATLLTIGTGVAAAGVIALRMTARFSAAMRYAIALSLFGLLLLVALRPEAAAAAQQNRLGAVPSLYVPAAWARLIFFAWATVAAVSWLRVMIGIHRVRRLKRESVAISPEAIPIAVRQLFKNASRFGREVKLVSSEHIKAP